MLLVDTVCGGEQHRDCRPAVWRDPMLLATQYMISNLNTDCMQRQAYGAYQSEAELYTVRLQPLIWLALGIIAMVRLKIGMPLHPQLDFRLTCMEALILSYGLTDLQHICLVFPCCGSA